MVAVAEELSCYSMERFQDANTKDIMNPGSFQQLQLVGDLTNTLHHLE